MYALIYWYTIIIIIMVCLVSYPVKLSNIELLTSPDLETSDLTSLHMPVYNLQKIHLT